MSPEEIDQHTRDFIECIRNDPNYMADVIEKMMTKKIKLKATVERQNSIHADYVAGMSWRDLEAKWGVSESGIRWVLRKFEKSSR